MPFVQRENPKKKKKKKNLQLHRFPTKQKISKLILLNFFLNRNDRELSQNDSATNSSSNLLAALDIEPDVVVVVTDDDEGLEASSLTGTVLFLNEHDLHDLVLETRAELVHDLVLLDWEQVEVDLLQGSYLIRMDEASKLCDRHPLLLLSSPTVASTTSTVTSRASST